MAQYAYFDPNHAAPSPVLGWYDTDHGHPYMPPDHWLLVVTPGEWEGRMANPSGWAVASGKLVPHVRRGIHE